MKLKFLLFILCVFITSILAAQNLTLAKAFYKKAQQEYSHKNYLKVFKLLEKTKEQLGGESNPEITYLEAKTHYNNDINVAKAKTLLTQFLEEADPNDSRIDEISSLIVDIEVSDKIDKNGDFINLTGRSGIKTSYYATGEKEWVEEFKNGKKNGFIKRYNKKGTLIQSGTQKNGYVTGFYSWYDSKGRLTQTNYFNTYGKKTKEQKNYNTTNGKLQFMRTYLNGKKHGPYKYYSHGKLSSEGNYENDKLKGKYTNYHTNGKIRSVYTYNNSPSYNLKIQSFIEGIKTSYYFTGIKMSEENYVKGKKQGRQKYYWANGKLKRWEHINTNGKLYGDRAYYYKSNGKRAINISYEDGKAIELLEQLDSNGKKLKISKLKKGIGYIKRVNDAGTIIYEANFVDGYEEGPVKSYFDNGVLKDLIQYKNGNPFGEGKYYFNDGSLSYIYNHDTKKSIFTNPKQKQSKKLLALLQEQKSIDEIITYFKSKNQKDKDFYLSEEVINSFGYYVMNTKNNIEGALKIFEANIAFYPTAWNTYDSYGECLLKLGKKEDAIAAYKKSLVLNPKNDNAIKVLKEF